MTTNGNSTVCIWTCQKHSKAVSARIVTSTILLKPISQFILKTWSDSFQTHASGEQDQSYFCTIWFFTTWVDHERSGANGRTAEVLGILTKLALFPLLPPSHQMSGMYMPLTDNCSNFTWTTVGTRNWVDISWIRYQTPQSYYHQSHWIREPIQEGWQVH